MLTKVLLTTDYKKNGFSLKASVKFLGVLKIISLLFLQRV